MLRGQTFGGSAPSVGEAIEGVALVALVAALSVGVADGAGAGAGGGLTGASVTAAGAAGFGGGVGDGSLLPSQSKTAPSRAATPRPKPIVHFVKRRLLRANSSSRSSGNLGGAKLAATPTVDRALTPDAPPLGGREENRPLPCDDS